MNHKSPAPNFDKLSFETRKQLLSLFEFVTAKMLEQKTPISEIEKALLSGMAMAEHDFLALESTH